MADYLRVSPEVVVPLSELKFQASRSSGPGGQGVNTTDSKVELSFDVANTPALSDFLRARALLRLDKRLHDGVLTVTSSEQRSQFQNRVAAQRRLIEILAEAIAPPPPSRRPTRPTRSSQKRRVDEKQARGETKKLRRPPAIGD